MSVAPFCSLNLGFNVGDDPLRVAENHARLAREVGYEADELFEVSQVHGALVHETCLRAPRAEFRTREGDALVARVQGEAVAVRVADCVPILLANPETGAVAAVHAGWRGIVAQVIRASVDVLCTPRRTDPTVLLAAIGPHIGVDAFEVAPEVAHQLAVAARDPGVIATGHVRPHVDLGRAAWAQLLGAGLLAARVERLGGCTFRDHTQFFSFRRDGKASGRHLAVIVAGC